MLNQQMAVKERREELKNFTFEFMIPIVDPNSMFNQPKVFEVEEPTVDDILDKINNTGIKSLTKEEIKFLDEQSKK